MMMMITIIIIIMAFFALFGRLGFVSAKERAPTLGNVPPSGEDKMERYMVLLGQCRT